MTAHGVNEEVIINEVKAHINKLKWCTDITVEKLDETIKTMTIKTKDFSSVLQNLKEKKEQIDNQLADLTLSYIKKIIKSEDAYRQVANSLELEQKIISEQINKVENEMKDKKDVKSKILDSISLFKKIENSTTIDREVITLLIDKILVKEYYINKERQIDISIIWNQPFNSINEVALPCSGGDLLEDKIRTLVSLYLKVS